MSHLHRPTAIVLQALLNRYNKRVLYISHGYKFPLNYALREPSPWGENARTQVSSRRVCKQTLVTDEGLNSLCHKPLTTAARSLSPGRSLEQSEFKQKFEAVKSPINCNLSFSRTLPLGVAKRHRGSEWQHGVLSEPRCARAAARRVAA